MNKVNHLTEGSALLLMDFQNEIVDSIPVERRTPALDHAAAQHAAVRSR